MAVHYRALSRVGLIEVMDSDTRRPVPSTGVSHADLRESVMHAASGSESAIFALLDLEVYTRWLLLFPVCLRVPLAWSYTLQPSSANVPAGNFG